MDSIDTEGRDRKSRFHAVAESLLDQPGLPFAEVLTAEAIEAAFAEHDALFAGDDIDRPMPAQRDEIIAGLLDLPGTGLICTATGTAALGRMDAQVRSRLSPALVGLPAYTVEELEQILAERATAGLLEITGPALPTKGKLVRAVQA